MSPPDGPPYQEPPTDQAEASWERGYIDAWDLFKMLAWKSANANLAYLSTEDPDRIHTVTATAIATLRPYRHANAFTLRGDAARWEEFRDATYAAVTEPSGLRALGGVGMPTASAVLALLNPRAWPVIDRHAANALFDSPPGDERRRRFDTYWAYVEGIVTIGPHVYPGATVHAIDNALMALGRNGGRPPFAKLRFPLP
jgi:hypothetical protein